MSDLLSSLDKSNIHAIFDDLHDTFARDITIYVSEDGVLIDTDGNHNPIYKTPSSETSKTLKPIVTKARIKYNDIQDRVYGPDGSNSQLNMTFPKGSIRLKVNQEAYALIVKAKKISIDDRLCELVSAPSRPGPFNPNYWTINLNQID